MVDRGGPVLCHEKNTYLECGGRGIFREYMYLPPTGSEERGVLGVGSIPVAILPSCQDMKLVALSLQKHEYSWVVNIRNTSEAVLRSQYTPWPSYYSNCGPMGYGQYITTRFLVFMVSITA